MEPRIRLGRRPKTGPRCRKCAFRIRPPNTNNRRKRRKERDGRIFGILALSTTTAPSGHFRERRSKVFFEIPRSNMHWAARPVLRENSTHPLSLPAGQQTATRGLAFSITFMTADLGSKIIPDCGAADVVGVCILYMRSALLWDCTATGRQKVLLFEEAVCYRLFRTLDDMARQRRRRRPPYTAKRHYANQQSAGPMFHQPRRRLGLPRSPEALGTSP